MLGFALSEAQRSQELMKRLQSVKTVAGGGLSVGHSSSAAAIRGGGGGLGALGGVGGSDASEASGTTGGAHRRRRRRRTKKVFSGGGACGGSSTTHSGGGGESSPSSINSRNSNLPQRNVAGRPKQHDAPMTKRDLYFSLRCGMVSTGPGGKGTAVGRVTIVNWDNQIVLDTFVKVPPEQVFDYRTEETGITAELLAMTSALRFETARTKVGKLIRGKILIGHGLEVDLNALGLTHPWSDVRDTATYVPYMKQVAVGDFRCSSSIMYVPRSLGELMNSALGRGLNADQPSLVREAIACLDLYKFTRTEWEKELVQIIQQKERQREMVLNMRVGPQLSAINEDSEVAAAAASMVVGSVTSSGHHVRLDEYETYEDSTIASTSIATEPTNYSNNMGSFYYVVDANDDHSESSSFLTRDTDSEIDNFSRLRLDAVIPSHIENLSQLDTFHTLSVSQQPFMAPGSSTAYANVSYQEHSHSSPYWSHGASGSAISERGGLPSSTTTPTTTGGGGEIWTLMHESGPSSVAGSAEWPHNSPLHTSVYVLPHQQNIHTAASHPHLSLTEEEVLEHLPSHLLADIEQEGNMMAPVASDRSNQSDDKKKGWFGRERRRSGSNSLGVFFGGNQDRSARATTKTNYNRNSATSGTTTEISMLTSSVPPWYPDAGVAKPQTPTQKVGIPPGFV